MKSIWKTALLLALVGILASLLAACSGAPPLTAKAAAAAVAVDSPPGVFEVSSLAVNPARVNAGVASLIAARITNTGSTDRLYQGNIKIIDAVNPGLPSYLPSEKVNIKAGDTQILSVSTTLTNPGTYQVFWDQVGRTLEVDAADNTLAATAQPTAPLAAFDFSGTDVVTGQKVTLGQYRGSIVLLNFVNYGCNPAINQKVGIQLEAIKQLRQQGLDFVPISVFCGCCPLDVLRQFAQDNGYNWPWILDTDYSIASKYSGALQQYGYPTLVFIDRDQVIRDVSGATDVTGLTEKLNQIGQDQTN